MSVAMWNCHSWPLDVSSIGQIGSSAKFGVAVFKTSILDSLGGPLAKVGSSAKFGIGVFKVSVLNSLGSEGVHQPKYVHLFSITQGGPSAKISFHNNTTY